MKKLFIYITLIALVVSCSKEFSSDEYGGYEMMTDFMLSEYEQNLIKETEGPGASGIGHNGHRRGRKWSLFRQPTLQTIHSEDEELSMTRGVGGFGAARSDIKGDKSDKKNIDNATNVGINNLSLYRLGHQMTKNNGDNREREIPSFSNFSRRFPASGPKRSITVIDEASV